MHPADQQPNSQNQCQKLHKHTKFLILTQTNRRQFRKRRNTNKLNVNLNLNGREGNYPMWGGKVTRGKCTERSAAVRHSLLMYMCISLCEIRTFLLLLHGVGHFPLKRSTVSVYRIMIPLRVRNMG